MLLGSGAHAEGAAIGHDEIQAEGQGQKHHEDGAEEHGHVVGAGGGAYHELLGGGCRVGTAVGAGRVASVLTGGADRIDMLLNNSSGVRPHDGDGSFVPVVGQNV